MGLGYPAEGQRRGFILYQGEGVGIRNHYALGICEPTEMQLHVHRKSKQQ